jgi:hypothetical protein
VIVDWSADTDISDDGEHARTVLRRMVLRLGELAAVGAVDPRTTVGSFHGGEVRDTPTASSGICADLGAISSVATVGMRSG